MGEGTHIYIHNPTSSPADEFQTTEQSIKNGHAKLIEQAKRKQAMVRKMAIEGADDVEIAEATGYSISSIRRFLTQWRKDGEDIPLRKRGRKCKKQRE